MTAPEAEEAVAEDLPAGAMVEFTVEVSGRQAGPAAAREVQKCLGSACNIVLSAYLWGTLMLGIICVLPPTACRL